MRFVLPILFLAETIFAQNKDTLHTLSADLGLGYSRYLTTLEFPELNKNGFSGIFRVMWHPEHLLSVGLETGYQYLYSIRSEISSEEFGSSDLEASMISVPFLFTASMVIFPETLPKFEVNGGWGAFFMFNYGSLYGSSIYSSVFSLGYHAGASYIHPLNDDVSIGGEVKYFYISKLQDSDLSILFLVSYNFLSW